MTPGPAVRVQALPLELTGARSPLWWGMVMLAVIEVVGYATLFTAYLYLRFHTPAWPPAGMPRPSVVLGIVAMLLLLTSAAAVRWAAVGLLHGNPARLRPGFAAAAALAIAFLITQGIERVRDGFRWDENAYASIVWTIHLVHALHIVVLITIGAGVFLLAGRQFYSRERRLGIEILALFWYVVALAWLPIFAVLYLVAW